MRGPAHETIRAEVHPTDIWLESVRKCSPCQGHLNIIVRVVWTERKFCSLLTNESHPGSVPGQFLLLLAHGLVLRELGDAEGRNGRFCVSVPLQGV